MATTKKETADKQENLIMVSAKENVSVDDVFIKAGEKKGLTEAQVKTLMSKRNTKSLIEVQK